MVGTKVVCGTLAALVGFDILAINTSIAFITRYPVHPARSAIFTLFAFGQLSVAFAVLYALVGHQFDPVELTGWKAVCFSVVTITTVGYGDLRPKPDAWISQGLVVLELAAGLYFLAVLLTIVVQWANEGPTWRRPPVQSPRPQEGSE